MHGSARAAPTRKAMWSFAAPCPPATISIPVEFKIPYDAPATGSRNTDDEILWRLTAKRLFFGYGLGQAFSWVLGMVPLVIVGGMGLLLLAIAFGLRFGATTVEVIDRELRVQSTYLLFSGRS